MCRFVRCFIVGVCALLVAGSLQAQTTTGRLIGSVLDEGGAPLPGVTVTIESEALLGGPRTEITNANGEYSFLGLHPGYYHVRASLQGFPTQERSEIKVRLGGAAKLIIEMPSGTFAGEIEVVAETPVVDPTQVNMEQVFDAAYMQKAAIGSGGRSYQQILYQAAGSDNSVESDGNPSVFGSTSGENTYYIDGMDTTDPITSTFAHNFNFDAVEEVQFQTAGYEAEFGRTIGGVVNLVTKSGGNTFSGTADLRYHNQSFYENGEHFDASVQDNERYSIAATLGGPVIRDKLWFFVAYDYIANNQTPTGAPATYQFTGNYPFAKLSWQASPAWRVVAKYSGDPVDIDNRNVLDAQRRASTLDTMTARKQGGFVTNAEVNAVLTDSLLWNVLVGIKRSELTELPKTDASVIAHDNYATHVFTDNWYRQEYGDRNRDELATDLSWFVDNLAGSHEFKFGAEYGKFMEMDSTICLTGETDGDGGCDPGTQGSYFRDNIRTDYGFTETHPYYWRIDDTIPPQDYVGNMYSLFAQDSWRPISNLTVKAGLRYDDITWKDNNNQERIWFDKMQPRLGFAWDITGDARNVLRGNWGRFMHPANSSVPSFLNTEGGGTYYYAGCTAGAHRVLGEPLFLSPDECQALAADLGWEYITDPDGWDPSGWIGPFFSAASEPTEVDPNLRPAYADQWAIAYERALWERTSIEISYLEKQTNDILEDTCRGNFYDGPSVDADCGAFLIFNQPQRNHSGATVRFETRSFDSMTLLASYTYSHSVGSADTRHYFQGDWDFYPWDFIHKHGYTMQHRRHRVKLNGFFLLPYDFTVGFDAFWADRFRYNVITDEALTPNTPPGTEWLLEPRGSRMGNDNYQIDLQVAKGFKAGSTRLEVIFTVLNALSTELPRDADDVCERVGGCSDPEGDGLVGLGDAIAWQTPRRFELGFRVEF